MCKYMSFLVTPDGVIGSNNTDSHEALIHLYDLNDTLPLSRRSFVRVEYVPTDHGWKYSIDEEEVLPAWYDEVKAVARVHRAAIERLRGLRAKIAPGECFAGANLQDANLRGAYLQGAKLQGADLRGADLQDTALRGAILPKTPYS